jgi:hypothetical protein
MMMYASYAGYYCMAIATTKKATRKKLTRSDKPNEKVQGKEHLF